MQQRKIVIAFLSIAVICGSPMNPIQRAFAEDIIISGNGSDSANAASVSQQNTTTVQQSNDAEVKNDVTTNAETGNNAASNNNGDTAIVTGDASTSTTVSTQANASAVDTSGCCPQGENKITVSGNGAGSTNTADVTNTTSTTTVIHQTATITNNISGTATTGGNRANDNQGDVTIITGNIHHKEYIGTGPLNVAAVNVGNPLFTYTVNVDGNGAYTKNNVFLANDTTIHNFVTNDANIFNNSFWNLITGNNYASKNNGDVFIKTGDIKSEVTIENKANFSSVKETCCKVTQTPSPTPTQPTPPKEEGKPGGGGNGGGNGGGSSASTSTSAGGNVLPVTGGNWIMLAILGNVMMLLFGVMLRLRSGRSPGFRYNFVV